MFRDESAPRKHPSEMHLLSVHEAFCVTHVSKEDVLVSIRGQVDVVLEPQADARKSCGMGDILTSTEQMGSLLLRGADQFHIKAVGQTSGATQVLSTVFQVDGTSSVAGHEP